MVSSRRIAATAPNLAQFVEVSGGHCAILERPAEVNEHLRWLIESACSRGATRREEIIGLSEGNQWLRSAPDALRWPRASGAHRAVEEARPLVGGFRARPEDAVDRLAQPPSVRRPGPGRHRRGRATRRELLCAPAMVEVVDRLRGGLAEQRGEPGQRELAPLWRGSGSNMRASVNPSRIPGPLSLGLTSKVMNTGPSSDSASPESRSSRQNGLS